MGKQKYQKEIEAIISKSRVISFNSLEKIVSKNKKNRQYAKQLIRNLITKGKLKSLAKGYYTKYDEISLTIFCFQPAYFGLQDALSYHNLWEQETIPIIITTRKVRNGLRQVMGKNILIRRIQPKYYFGMVYSQQNSLALPYSDLEKTFIDLVYFKEKINPQVLAEFKKRIDLKKLNRYLANYPQRIKNKVKILI